MILIDDGLIDINPEDNVDNADFIDNLDVDIIANITI